MRYVLLSFFPTIRFISLSAAPSLSFTHPLSRSHTNSLLLRHCRLFSLSLLLSLPFILIVGQRHFDYVGQDSDSDSDGDGDGEAATGTGTGAGAVTGTGPINRNSMSDCETGGPIGTMDLDHGIHSTSCSTPPPVVTVPALSLSAPAAASTHAPSRVSSPAAIVAMTGDSSSTHDNSGKKISSSSSSSSERQKCKDSHSQCTVSGLQIWSIPYTPILLPDPQEVPIVEAPLVTEGGEAGAGGIVVGIVDGGVGEWGEGGIGGGGGVEGGGRAEGGDTKFVASNAMDVTEGMDIIIEGHIDSTLAQ
jgi:hypothetical protein